MPPIVPSANPSYRCSKDAGILDAKFVRQVDGLVFAHNRFDGAVIGGGQDAYLANADVVNLKGIGESRAHLLKSRMFGGIDTIGKFAAYTGDFDAPWARLDRQTVEAFRSLRASLQVCSLPADGKLGRKVTVQENDPGMEGYVRTGKEVIQHNAGKEGAAEIILNGDPTNNGFVPSYFSVDLSGYSAGGRRPGSHIEFEPLEVNLGPGLPATSAEVGEQLKAAFEEKGLAAEVEPMRGGGVRVKVWSNLVVD